jgi:hypothetical protein
MTPDEENVALRKILVRCADALKNGATVSENSSVEFLEHLPNEIDRVVGSLRTLCVNLEKILIQEGSVETAFRSVMASVQRERQNIDSLRLSREMLAQQVSQWIHLWRTADKQNADLRGQVDELTKKLLWRTRNDTVNNRQLFDELGFKGDHDDKVHKALLELKALREAAEAALSEHEARLGRCVCGICTPLKTAMGRMDE